MDLGPITQRSHQLQCFIASTTCYQCNSKCQLQTHSLALSICWPKHSSVTTSVFFPSNFPLIPPFFYSLHHLLSTYCMCSRVPLTWPFSYFLFNTANQISLSLPLLYPLSLCSLCSLCLSLFLPPHTHTQRERDSTDVRNSLFLYLIGLAVCVSQLREQLTVSVTQNDSCPVRCPTSSTCHDITFFPKGSI